VTDDVLKRLQEDPSTTGLFLDFDGTLSEIVHVPSEARPIAGTRELLAELGQVFGLVAIVSGRSATQLLAWLGPEIEIWGVHGAERAIGGSVSLTERAAPYRELMEVVHQEAEELLRELDLPGVSVEDKGVMFSLHFRAATDRERAERELDALADELARRHGLLRAGGRLAFELRPPVEFSKAAVVLDRAREMGLSAAAFFGDDRVDLPGFDALDLLEEEGLATLRVAVGSDEAPPELLQRADVVVSGPGGAVRLLAGLLPPR
jgi:trehalose 6-phosphate phosphatase